jgi:hypothetical protein
MKLSEPTTISEKIKRQNEVAKLMAAQRKREKNFIEVKVDERTVLLIDKNANPQERIDLFNSIRNSSRRFW